MIASTTERPFTDLDAEEIAALVAFRRRLAEEEAASIEPEPLPEPEPQPEPVEITHVDRFIPWDFRVVGWLMAQFALGSRDGVVSDRGQRMWLPRKVLVWLLLAYPRARRMLWVITSGKAKPGVAFERNQICRDCVRLKIDRKDQRRCGACGCPDWHFSRLNIKNRYAMNHCPEKRHPGEYVQLILHRWPNRQVPNQQPAQRRGCGGG